MWWVAGFLTCKFNKVFKVCDLLSQEQKRRVTLPFFFFLYSFESSCSLPFPSVVCLKTTHVSDGFHLRHLFIFLTRQSSTDKPYLHKPLPGSPVPAGGPPGPAARPATRRGHAWPAARRGHAWPALAACSHDAARPPERGRELRPTFRTIKYA